MLKRRKPEPPQAPELVGPNGVVMGVYESPAGIFVVKANKERSRLYAKKLEVIGGERLTEAGEHVNFEFVYDKGAIFNLRPDQRMSLERAKELAIRYGRCLNCGRRLKDATSVERGIGPVCIKAFGSILGIRSDAPALVPESEPAAPPVLGECETERRPYGAIVQEVLEKFPVRNPLWTYHKDGDSFSAFESDLRANDGHLDPWKRKLPPPTETHKREGDITHWTIITSVAGRQIELTLWND